MQLLCVNHIVFECIYVDSDLYYLEKYKIHNLIRIVDNFSRGYKIWNSL